MQASNRMLTITVLLLYLVCFHCVLQAQKNVPWAAVSIKISDNGKYLAINYGAEMRVDRSLVFISEVWLHDLENLLSPPQYLSEAAHDYHARMAFSPNSEYFAVGSRHGLTVFNTENNTVILDLLSSATPIHSDFSLFSFSPDSNYIAAFSGWWATRDHEMSIWDIHTGRRTLTVAANRSQQWIVHPWLSPDWRQFLDWSGGGYDGAAIYEFEVQQGLGQEKTSISKARRITGEAFSPDSSLFALATSDDEVEVYRTDTWELSYSKILDEGTCGNADVYLTFGRVNSWLAYWCNWDGNLLVWDLKADELLLQAITSTISLEFTLGDRMLMGSGTVYSLETSVISVWNTKNAFELTQYPGKSPSLHPNGELMAAIGPDGRVWIWNIKQDQLLVILPIPRDSGYSGSRRFSG